MSKSDDRILLRVEKGALVPADAFALAKLRTRGYAKGDLLLADLRKARNPRFWRLGHALGQMLIQNLPEFEHYQNAHSVVKRIQLESGVACDSIAIKGEFGMLEHRVPRSLSFSSMEEGEWRETFTGLCNWIRKRYWPELTTEAIEALAEMMPGETT